MDTLHRIKRECLEELTREIEAYENEGYTPEELREELQDIIDRIADERTPIQYADQTACLIEDVQIGYMVEDWSSHKNIWEALTSAIYNYLVEYMQGEIDYDQA